MLQTGACVEGRVNPMYGTAFDQEPLQEGAFSVRPAMTCNLEFIPVYSALPHFRDLSWGRFGRI